VPRVEPRNETDADDAPLEWDARTYQDVSVPQQRWGDEVLGRLQLRGDETVLDLGCGAGQVTEKLVALVPCGRVIALDASAAMVAAARARLGNRADVVQADLRTYVAADPVDLAFSTATLHWIPDHPGLWRRVRASLRPGGRLEAQYGGAGNIADVVDGLYRVAGQEPFATHLMPYSTVWTFDTAETAAGELQDAGFTDVQAWLTRPIARPPDARAFLAISIVPRELARLPEDLRDAFVTSLFDAIGGPDSYQYVRINVSATG
jgi:trans-aconitate 2-methyltransferase